MKKSILIFCSVTVMIGLTSFAYANWNNSASVEEKIIAQKELLFERDFTTFIGQNIAPDLVYKVDSRFIARITKSKLNQAKSIIDILPKEGTEFMETYENVVVTIFGETDEIKVIGNDEILNTAQLDLLKSADYSTNFYITATCKRRNENGELYWYNLVYYMTVMPEQEAEFTGGKAELVKYLKDNSKAVTSIITREKLKPGRFNFTVTKAGTIENVELTSTSGYSVVDERLVELIENMPKKWKAATNAKGEKVNQELIFFFGLEGC